MKPANGQLSIFDIIIDHTEQPKDIQPSVVSAPQIMQSPPNKTENLCPYPIPTVDDIIKQIDRSAYKVNKSKLISDVFECGAIALSNKVDLVQAEKREERYKQIMKTYQPQERELIADIFGKIFALLSSVVYDDGVFGDYLGDLFIYAVPHFKVYGGNSHNGR